MRTELCAAVVLVYCVTFALVDLLRSRARTLGRAAGLRCGPSTWRARRALSRARREGPAVAAPLPSAAHGGEAVIVAARGRAAFLPDAPELRGITRAALVRDRVGRCGLVLEAGGRAACVMGFGPMLRVLAQLRREAVPVETRVVPGPDPTSALAAEERAAIERWLQPGEAVVHVTPPGPARFVATDRRIGLRLEAQDGASCGDWLAAGLAPVNLAPLVVIEDLERRIDAWAVSSAGSPVVLETREPAVLLSLAGAGRPLELAPDEVAEEHGALFMLTVSSYMALLVAAPLAFLAAVLTGLGAALLGHGEGHAVAAAELAFPLVGLCVLLTGPLSVLARAAGRALGRRDAERLGASPPAPPPLDVPRTWWRDQLVGAAQSVAAGAVVVGAWLWSSPPDPQLELGSRVLRAEGLLLGAVVAAGLVRAGLRHLLRRRAEARLRAALASARTAGRASVVPLARGEAVVLAAGGRAALVPGSGELAPLERAVFAAGSGRRAGLLLQVGGRSAWVVGLEAVARAWSWLERDGVAVELALPGPGGAAELPRDLRRQLERQLAEGELLVGCAATPADSRRGGLVVTSRRLVWRDGESGGLSFVEPTALALASDGQWPPAWRLTLAPGAEGAPSLPAGLRLSSEDAVALAPFVARRLPTTVGARGRRRRDELPQKGLLFALALVASMLPALLLLMGSAMAKQGWHPRLSEALEALSLGAWLLFPALLVGPLVEDRLEWGHLAGVDEMEGSAGQPSS